MIVQKAKSVEEALFYIRKTIEGNLSRSALDDCIRADLYHTSGAAVNEFVKRDSDNPSIGLLICKDMDRTEVQLAFQGITTPMGVATYDNVKIKEIQEHFPQQNRYSGRLLWQKKNTKCSLRRKNSRLLHGTT